MRIIEHLDERTPNRYKGKTGDQDMKHIWHKSNV